MGKVMHLLFDLIIFTAVLCGVYFMYSFKGNRDVQFEIVLFIALFYNLWGVLKHYSKGDLHLKIMVEYLLVSVFAVLLYRGVFIK